MPLPRFRMFISSPNTLHPSQQAAIDQITYNAAHLANPSLADAPALTQRIQFDRRRREVLSWEDTIRLAGRGAVSRAQSVLLYEKGGSLQAHLLLYRAMRDRLSQLVRIEDKDRPPETNAPYPLFLDNAVIAPQLRELVLTRLGSGRLTPYEAMLEAATTRGDNDNRRQILAFSYDIEDTWAGQVQAWDFSQTPQEVEGPLRAGEPLAEQQWQGPTVVKLANTIRARTRAAEDIF